MHKSLLTTLVLFCTFIQSTYGALNFASYNIRNFDYDERSGVSTNKNLLAKTINTLSADLIAVQEINNTSAFKRFVEDSVSGNFKTVLTKCGGAHKQRLGFIYNTSKFLLIEFKQDLKISNVNDPARAECNSGSRPLAIGKFEILATGETLVAISLHLKSGGRDKSITKRFKQLRILAQTVRNYSSQGIKNIVVMGDFNSTEFIFRGDLNEKFNRAVGRMGLIDTSKTLKCSAYWWGGREDSKQYPSQLDHILMSDHLMGSEPVKAKAHGHCARLQCAETYESDMGVAFDEVSDHCPIMTSVK